MKTTIQKCFEAVSTLNAQYGRGQVGEVRLTLAGEGEFVRVRTSCKPETRQFRVYDGPSGLTVYACGHQVTIKP